MKKFVAISFLLMVSVVAAAAQEPSEAQIKSAMKKFPGVSAIHMEAMLASRQVMSVALPTWLPAGFKVENLKVNLGSTVPIEERQFVVVYSRTLADGGKQRFALEAGFDGLGDLMYEPTKTLRTGVGKIILIYEPKDEEGNIEKEYVMTEWFTVGRTEFHYIGMYDFEEGDSSAKMISIEDTEKILMSLKRL